MASSVASFNHLRDPRAGEGARLRPPASTVSGLRPDACPGRPQENVPYNCGLVSAIASVDAQGKTRIRVAGQASERRRG